MNPPMVTDTSCARDRAESAFARIEVENAQTHIFISTRRADALAEAEAADRRRRDGAVLGPMDGLLVGIKDNIAVRGLPWTLGIGRYRDRIAEADATVVRRLKDAGAIILGTLNMHEGALGATTDNPHFGRCANPLKPGYTPGGSSGGSGAAVAAGLVDVALGTDTMGSVRIPAAYCGVAGLKPSRGAIGRGGLGYLSPTLDTIGPLAARADCLWPALRVLLGEDAADPDWAGPAVWPETPPSHDDLSGIRIGVPRQIEEVSCDAAVMAGFEMARTSAERAGARIMDVDLDGWGPSRTRRAGLLLAEAEAAAAMPELLNEPIDGVSEAFHGFLRYGRDASSAKLVAALAELRKSRAAFARASREFDALILPTAPQRAFPHGDAAPDNQADFTALANVAGGPAAAVPVWLDGEELPASVQLVGVHGSDARILSLAAAIERALQDL